MVAATTRARRLESIAPAIRRQPLFMTRPALRSRPAVWIQARLEAEQEGKERWEQLKLLQRMEEILERAQTQQPFEAAPAVLESRPVARTYYDMTRSLLEEVGSEVEPEEAAALAVTIDDVIERLAIVNWQNNPDVQNRMRIEIEDELFRFKDAHGLDLSFADMDRLMDTCIEVARRRSARA